ncbi:MAG: RidA family protein [Christensenellaceae bacterium]|jgi:2-iminobutanoate/2-iminopropanoate deaminase
MKKIIHTQHAPAAIGPYSQAVKAGAFLYVSGQLALDPGSGTLLDDSVATQTARALDNVKAIVEEAGYTMDDIISTTVYLISMDDFAEINEVYASYFTEGNYPARAAIEISALPRGGAVEISVVAYKE